MYPGYIEYSIGQNFARRALFEVSWKLEMHQKETKWSQSDLKHLTVKMYIKYLHRMTKLYVSLYERFGDTRLLFFFFLFFYFKDISHHNLWLAYWK